MFAIKTAFFFQMSALFSKSKAQSCTLLLKCHNVIGIWGFFRISFLITCDNVDVKITIFWWNLKICWKSAGCIRLFGTSLLNGRSLKYLPGKTSRGAGRSWSAARSSARTSRATSAWSWSGSSPLWARPSPPPYLFPHQRYEKQTVFYSLFPFALLDFL